MLRRNFSAARPETRFAQRTRGNHVACDQRAPNPTDPAHSNPKQEQAYARALEARNVPESLETIAAALAAAVASGA